MTAKRMTAKDIPVDVDEEWQPAVHWIERHLGGRVVRWERQARWRPAFFIDVECGDRLLPVYFRGDRGAMDNGAYSLEHEMRLLQALEAQDIPVPHVYGFCDRPRGIVMERLPGKSTLKEADSDAERVAVFDHYIEILARVHAVDTAPLEAIGLHRPRTAQEVALGDFARWEDSYRRRKVRPEPMMEFMIRWVHANTPPTPTGVSFIVSDPGQFLYQNGRVTAILDLEIAYIGDPAADFAGMRHRDMGEPLGDMKRALDLYRKITGKYVDPRVVDYHTVRFGIYTSLCSAHILAAPTPDIDLIQYSAWHLTGSRVSIETILRLHGLPLEPVTFPAPSPTRQSVDHLALVGMLETIHPTGHPTGHAAENFIGYRLNSAIRVARYLARAEDLGSALWAEDLDEVAAILGWRPANWVEGNAALEQLVLVSGPEREIELLQYFRRNLLRQEWLLRGQIPELEDAFLPPIH